MIDFMHTHFLSHKRARARTHAHTTATGLHDLSGVVADHVRAQQLVRARVDDELHEGAQGGARQRVAHGAEAGGVDVQVGVAGREGALLAQALRSPPCGSVCVPHGCVYMGALMSQ